MAKQVDITREDYQVFYPVTTRWNDNDVYGHVNNVTYYSYFDTAANTFLINQCGLDIHQGQIVGLVVSSGCDYLEPVEFPEKLEVGLRIDHLGNSSVQYALAIFKEKQRNACAFGRFTHVFVNRTNNRPERIPDTMRAVMKRILVEAST
jgi:acyl-CoA thioester hydrolase